MKKRELASFAAEILRTKDIRKPVKIKKHVFTVSDPEGNSADFAVRQRDRRVLYTVDDVNNIMDACLEAAIISLRHGEEVDIRGFGTISLQLTPGREVYIPGTTELVKVPEHHIPKFRFGNDLRMAAKIYDLSLKDNAAVEKLHSLEDRPDEHDEDLEW